LEIGEDLLREGKTSPLSGGKGKGGGKGELFIFNANEEGRKGEGREGTAASASPRSCRGRKEGGMLFYSKSGTVPRAGRGKEKRETRPSRSMPKKKKKKTMLLCASDTQFSDMAGREKGGRRRGGGA